MEPPSQINIEQGNFAGLNSEDPPLQTIPESFLIISGADEKHPEGDVAVYGYSSRTGLSFIGRISPYLS